MNGEDRFHEMAREKFAELEKQEKELKARLDEIQKQKTPLKKYLQSAGLIEVRRRGPRRKKAAESGGAAQ